MTQEEIRIEFDNKIRNSFIKIHNQCQYCKEKAAHIHHLIPIAYGGDNRESNLIPLCIKCHSMLHNKKYSNDWKELQRIGIERAKKEGKFKGGQPKKINKESYQHLKQQYLTQKITKKIFAENLGVSRPTLNNILKNEEKYGLI